MYKKITINLELEDWNYLEKIAQILGQKKSQIVRESVRDMTRTLRKVFGDEPVKNNYDLANFYKVMMVETSRALGKLADTDEDKPSTSKVRK